MKKVLHYPTLKTILDIEYVLREAMYPLTRYQILKRLNNKVMKQTLNVTLDYMEKHGMIVDGPKGIHWTYVPKDILEKQVREGLEV